MYLISIIFITVVRPFSHNFIIFFSLLSYELAPHFSKGSTLAESAAAYLSSKTAQRYLLEKIEITTGEEEEHNVLQVYLPLNSCWCTDLTQWLYNSYNDMSMGVRHAADFFILKPVAEWGIVTWLYFGHLAIHLHLWLIAASLSHMIVLCNFFAIFCQNLAKNLPIG